MFDYDDEQALEEYIRRNRHFFLSPFEEQAIQLGIKREKAKHKIEESGHNPPTWALRALRESEVEIDDAIRDAIGNDSNSLVTFQEEMFRRIDSAFARGKVRPNRCPVCNRIVKTPASRQCLWCGHDWHNG